MPETMLLSPSRQQEIEAALAEGRARTWLLLDGVPDEVLARPACAYLSPPVWDLGHIANFEELWLVQNLFGRGEMHDGDNDTYDAFRHARPERPSLPLLDTAGARRYLDEVRTAVLESLRSGTPAPGTGRLLEGGFVHQMIVLHEAQHQETLLQSLQMRGPEACPRRDVRPLLPPRPRPDRGEEAWCRVPAGTFAMGWPAGPGTYDNESPAHEVDVAAFEIARWPVTCGAYLEFLEAGGYGDARLWSQRGRAWLDQQEHHAPLYWTQRRSDGAWHRTTLADGTRPVADVADEILCHVTCFEAEAYARWRGVRLPTEAEWEKACRASGQGIPAGRNPWGDGPATTGLANIDQLAYRPSEVGSHPSGAAPCGAEHMVGDVWEWCASGFDAYPGFEAFPYPEYSEVFFGGDFRMLRGGSWATRAGCAHGTFRNWDHPYRRQVFAGIRLARDG